MACHQAEGHGKVGFAPFIRNRDFLAMASDDFIFQNVKHGRTGTPMRPFGGSRGLANLSDQEISDVIELEKNEAPTDLYAACPKHGAERLPVQHLEHLGGRLQEVRCSG